MSRRRIAAPVIASTLAIVLAACGSTTPTATQSASATTTAPVVAPSPAGSSASGARELRSGPLAPGTYIRSDFRPTIAFTVGNGWTVGNATNGFFDVQRDQGTPDVIAVQFARVDGVVGEGGSTTSVRDAAEALAAIRRNPDLTVVDESEPSSGGSGGAVVVVENRGTGHAGVMKTAPGLLGIDAGRKLRIALLDTADGVLAIMVGGSIAQWDKALKAAEPVLDSVFIQLGPGASPSGSGG